MKKILLVSSATAFLERNRNLLKRTEFRIATATTGAEALRMHRERLFDLVITEHRLADMEGDRLCSLLRGGEMPRCPAVILTCRAAPADLVRAEQSGANVVLTRPLQPEQLIRAVERLLTTHLVRSPRAHLRVKVVSRKGDLEFCCVSHNISATGMLLETDRQLDLRDRLFHQFALPGTSQIKAEGEVVRSVRTLAGRHQYGVQFIGLAEECRLGIDSYVATSAGGNG